MYIGVSMMSYVNSSTVAVQRLWRIHEVLGYNWVRSGLEFWVSMETRESLPAIWIVTENKEEKLEKKGNAC